MWSEDPKEGAYQVLFASERDQILHCHKLVWKGGLFGPEGPKKPVIHQKGPRSVWEGGQKTCWPLLSVVWGGAWPGCPPPATASVVRPLGPDFDPIKKTKHFL